MGLRTRKISLVPSRIASLAMRALFALGATAVGALAVWLMVGTGFANYDTVYSLLWGADVAHGRSPDYEVPVAPTPHPLATFAGVVLSPLGADAEGAAVLLALVFLGALGWVTYALGSQWFGPAAGVLAAVISSGIHGMIIAAAKKPAWLAQ